MKHLAALQIFLLNISYIFIIYTTKVHPSRTPKMYVKTVGEKMLILKFAILHRYYSTSHRIERYSSFSLFCSFCLFPFCRLVKIVFVFSIRMSISYIYTMKTVCLRRYRLCEKLLAKRRGNK